jgi:hypothetical protein
MENEVRGQPAPTNLEDTSLIAFLLYKGHKIHPWRDSTERNHVVFDVIGDSQAIEIDMDKYYNNEQVGIQDYVRCLKEVKSQMYNLKKIK